VAVVAGGGVARGRSERPGAARSARRRPDPAEGRLLLAAPRCRLRVTTSPAPYPTATKERKRIHESRYADEVIPRAA
jgi:hypothetical protein